VRLAEAYKLIAELTAQAGRRLAVQIEPLSGRVEELEGQARKDSSFVVASLSSDSPCRKKGGDRSLRERGNRRATPAAVVEHSPGTGVICCPAT
jgi:hypothetical protein